MLKMVVGDFLQAQDEQQKLQELVDEIAGILSKVPELNVPLEALGLEPTSRAWWLAAECAVNVLLAHEFGQQVRRDEDADAEGSQP